QRDVGSGTGPVVHRPSGRPPGDAVYIELPGRRLPGPARRKIQLHLLAEVRAAGVSRAPGLHPARLLANPTGASTAAAPRQDRRVSLPFPGKPLSQDLARHLAERLRVAV